MDAKAPSVRVLCWDNMFCCLYWGHHMHIHEQVFNIVAAVASLVKNSMFDEFFVALLLLLTCRGGVITSPR